jgi:phosphoenolpyruvate phosphomutase
MERFVSKIRAAKSAQQNPDFAIIARTEAFIAGLGLDVALTRAYAYAEAGADIILVHSKAETATEIAQFMEHWTYPIPIAVVPTTYASTTTQELQDLGVKVVIYANQGIRATVKVLRTLFSDIAHCGHASGREDLMVSIQEIFALQGTKQPTPF